MIGFFPLTDVATITRGYVDPPRPCFALTVNPQSRSLLG